MIEGRWQNREGWGPRHGPPSAAWSGVRRRAVRYALLFFSVAFVVPLVLGVVLATTIGGWASVVVAVVSWAALFLLLILLARSAFRWFRPARDLIEATERLAEGDHAARVATSSSSPFGPVARSFNRMATRLETADQQRRQLLADIGHELRTPLTVVRGDLEAMADGVRPLDEEQIRLLLQDVSVMERLLDDLRTLSTAEAGQLTLHREPTDLGALVGDVVGRLEPEAAAQEVALSLRVVGGTAGDLEAPVDPVRIGEVVSNLVVNALRACQPHDRIEVTLGREPDQDPPVIRLDVADTGSGIADDETERVFDRFHKGPASQGSGLGLTISRDLVGAHGGAISLSSSLGEGTTVTVRLPGS